jgi:hypothetical protein
MHYFLLVRLSICAFECVCSVVYVCWGMESTSNAHIWRGGCGVLNAVGNASALRANGARALLLFLGGNILRFLIQRANLCASTAPRVYIYIIRHTRLYIWCILFYHAAFSQPTWDLRSFMVGINIFISLLCTLYTHARRW